MARVLITGCSSGIGRATTTEFTRRGYEVVATARRLETLADLDADLRLALDVSLDASVGAALAAAGPIDVLVNNAGFGVLGPIELVPLSEVHRQFETNFSGAVRMIQGVLPGMRARGNGTIVNVTGVSGRMAFPLSGFYCATKFALEALSESLHLEVGRFGIRVVIVEPGQMATRFGENVVRVGLDGSPYEPLGKIMQEAHEGLDAQDPAVTAVEIADAVESTEPRLRWTPGADLVIEARRSMDDAAFEAALRSVMNIDW